MLGRIVWTGKWLPRVRLREERVNGLAILRAELPGGPDSRGAERRWKSGVRRLERAGVKQLLLPAQKERQAPAGGPRPVITRPLWQQMAAPLAVTAILSAGDRPERVVVALRGERVTQPVFETCCRLMGAVRALSLTMPQGGEELAWWLERQYGVPVLAEGGDLTLCFAPDVVGPDRFLLGEEQPSPTGYTIALREAGAALLPADCPTIPLMTVLWEEGRLRADELRVVKISEPALGN